MSIGTNGERMKIDIHRFDRDVEYIDIPDLRFTSSFYIANEPHRVKIDSISYFKDEKYFWLFSSELQQLRSLMRYLRVTESDGVFFNRLEETVCKHIKLFRMSEVLGTNDGIQKVTFTYSVKR